MAGNSSNDPLIVSSWEECLSALTSHVKYIKFADSDNKYIETVNIDRVILCECNMLDFNGWTIDTINVSNIDDYYVFKRYYGSSTYGVGWAKNLTCNHLNFFKTCKGNIHFINIIRDFYLYDVWYESHDSAYTDRYDNAFDFHLGAYALCGTAYMSIIHMRSQDYAPRIPTLTAKNCEIHIDYKWTKTGAGNNSLLFGIDHGSSSPYDVGQYYCCYITGKIDLSEGSGEWQWTSPESAYIGVLRVASTIFNIEVITSENCTFDRLKLQETTDIGGKSALFVINNGNSMSRFNQVINLGGAVYKTYKEDLKNKDLLRNKNFDFIDDDDFRYPQYNDGGTLSDRWQWRKSNYINSSIPFLPFFIYPIYVPPVYRGDVYESEYICIYDLATQQDGFTGHGLAILRPTSCRVVEELNGAYNLTLVHPKDNEGRWQYILEMNIIKCMGQLFVIQRVDEVLNGGSYSVTAYAEHISYTLNDRWIFPPVTIAGYHGSTLMESILEQSTDMGGDWQTQYTFTVSSDIDAPEDFRDWYEMPDGVTPYEMLLGSNGFIAKLGGELYRDNFTLKINERMYGAEENAFELSIGYNLTGIKRTVDLTTFVTYLRCYDVSDGEYGTWWAVSWDPSSLPRAYPRNVVRSKNFTYDHEEYKEGQLERDGYTFWNQDCAPLISYELNVVDLKRSPEYKDFANNYRFKVGDKGKVWDERMQAWVDAEITRTEKDGITGETTKVIIGSQRSFTRPNSYNPIVPVRIDADKILEGVTPITFYSDGNNLKSLIIYGNDEGVGEDITAPMPFRPEQMHYNPQTGNQDSETGYYEVGAFTLTGQKTYTVSAEFESTSEQLVFEVLYYKSDYQFLSSEIAPTAGDSFTFTTPQNAAYMRIQAATSEVITAFKLTYMGIHITVIGSTTKELTKPISSKLYTGDTLELTNEVQTNVGENVLTISSETAPRVKMQYKEPI